MRGKNFLLLAYLPTCLLAYLRTCPLYLLCFLGGRLVSRLVPTRAVPSFRPPFRPVLIVSSSRWAIREAGRFFSSARLIRRVRIPNTPRRFS